MNSSSTSSSASSFVGLLLPAARLERLRRLDALLALALEHLQLLVLGERPLQVLLRRLRLARIRRSASRRAASPARIAS